MFFGIFFYSVKNELSAIRYNIDPVHYTDSIIFSRCEKTLRISRKKNLLTMKHPFSVISEGQLLYWCKFCEARLPEKDFLRTSIQEGRRQCKKCNVQHVLKYRKLHPYAKMLMRLRAKEKRKGGCITRDIHPRDIEELFESRCGHLLNKTWTTEEKNLFLNKMRAVRFWSDVPWSPENCTFIPKTVAKHHEKLVVNFKAWK
jgi:hypothetical protein